MVIIFGINVQYMNGTKLKYNLYCFNWKTPHDDVIWRSFYLFSVSSTSSILTRGKEVATGYIQSVEGPFFFLTLTTVNNIPIYLE